jgi:hypothetical protein
MISKYAVFVGGRGGEDGMGFELRGSCLQGRPSTAWTTSPAAFALVTFYIGSHLFAQADLDHHPPVFCFPPLLGWYVHSTMPSFFQLRSFLPWLAGNRHPFNLSLPRRQVWALGIWLAGVLLSKSNRYFSLQQVSSRWRWCAKSHQRSTSNPSRTS